MKILIADPAKNITVFILEPVETPAERRALAMAILADTRLRAEQVGFVTPPSSGKAAPGTGAPLWRLDMAGGEFCGNAARSFGLYVARMMGLTGRTKVFVSVSGAVAPVSVEVDVEKGQASAEMPKPVTGTTLNSLPALTFEGITHIIAPDVEPGSESFYAIKALAKSKLAPFSALGVMFYNTASRFMRPAVYVASTDSLVFESSCGSGSAALGVWLSRELFEGTARYTLNQPGGVIETEVTKKAGELTKITIGGEVKLYEPLDFLWQTGTAEINNNHRGHRVSQS